MFTTKTIGFLIAAASLPLFAPTVAAHHDDDCSVTHNDTVCVDLYFHARCENCFILPSGPEIGPTETIAMLQTWERGTARIPCVSVVGSCNVLTALDFELIDEEPVQAGVPNFPGIPLATCQADASILVLGFGLHEVDLGTVPC